MSRGSAWVGQRGKEKFELKNDAYTRNLSTDIKKRYFVVTISRVTKTLG